MAITDPDQGRESMREVMAQPAKYLFGADRPIFNTALALITPVPKDTPTGKGWSCAHVIIDDIPGTGKTALFTHISSAVMAKFGRIDGGPDLMPGDLKGREEKDRWSGVRTLMKGPLHSNIFNLDEINKTPPKAYAPMHSAMEGGTVFMNVTNEKEGRIDSVPFPLYPISDDPNEKRMFFIVFATMNPIDFEGTYPLSEALKERATFKFDMGAASREEEMMISAENVVGKTTKTVMNCGDLLDIHEMIKKMKLSKGAKELRMRYIENSNPYTRDKKRFGGPRERRAKKDLIKFVNEFVTSGCSRRRNYHMESAAKAYAWMRGENEFATVDDMKAIAAITMEHVILLESRSFQENITEKDVVHRIIEETDVSIHD